MPVDTSNFEVPPDTPNYKYLTPYVNGVKFLNHTVGTSLYVRAYDRELKNPASNPYQPNKDGKLWDLQNRTFEFFDIGDNTPHFSLTEGMEVECGASIEDGDEKRDEKHIYIASAKPWKDGNFYHGLVYIEGTSKDPKVSSKNVQKADKVNEE